MKHPFFIFLLLVAGLSVAVLNAVLPPPPGRSAVPTTFPADVTQHHHHDSRDGLYLDPLFTQAAAAGLTRDLNFNGTIVGNVYAQPLYLDSTSSPIGPVVFVVTESNNVYALNAVNGSIIWQRNVGTPITSGLPCGNISPLGITGTPVIDIASRTLFFDAETTPAAGTFKHLIYSLNADTGAINPGWPVDVGAVVSGFDSSAQSSRGALGLVGGVVYVPYGGRFGDCGNYRGRLVGVQMNNPASVMSWATGTTMAGVWAPGGVASDGTNTYVTTGNGSGTTWAGNEAVIRLQPGPVFSGSTTDYWAPTNWMTLDAGDTDLSGSGPILVDVPGATPSAIVVAIGKDRNAYLLNRANLGGVSAPLAQANVSTGTIIGAAATYWSTGTFVVLRPVSGTLTAFRITATNPPTIATGWSVSSSGRTSPFVTTTPSTNEAIVWAAGSDGRLRGYNGDTGAVIFNGGGTNELMAGIRSFNTGIAARGRIYYATDNKVYAFTVPTGGATPTPTATATPTGTPTPTATATSTATATATPTSTPTATPIGTPTATPVATATATPTSTPTATPVGTPTATPIATATATPTATPTGSPTATPTASPTGTPAPTAAQALNISTRLRVETGNNVAIGGFIVTGNTPKKVVVRGLGPSLSVFGLTDVLADPTLELRAADGSVILQDDNWQDDPVQAAQLTALGLAPSDAKESALVVTLQPGASYTAILAGKNGGAGVGLVEIYDADSGQASQLGNISTRGFVRTGSNVMIGGFILGRTNGSTRVAVRGLGPSLSQSGLTNVLADPTLELRDSNGALLISNDNWQDDPVSAAQLTANGLALTDTHESGIFTTLPPGAYTAILAGKNGGIGLGLVEVYNLR